MTQVLNIHQRILGIMSELSYIQKGDARVNGQYRFVSHDQAAEAVHDLLVKYGVTVIPTVEQMTQDGNRTRVDLNVVFTNADNPEDRFVTRYCGYGIDGGGYDKDGKERAAGDKGPGKAISYAFKYSLLKTFCLKTGDDPDNDAKSSYEPEKCLDFDSKLPEEYNDKERKKVLKFIDERSKALNRHPEDMKREALKRLPEFLEAIKKWNEKKKD